MIVVVNADKVSFGSVSDSSVAIVAEVASQRASAVSTVRRALDTESFDTLSETLNTSGASGDIADGAVRAAIRAESVVEGVEAETGSASTCYAAVRASDGAKNTLSSIDSKIKAWGALDAVFEGVYDHSVPRASVNKCVCRSQSQEDDDHCDGNLVESHKLLLMTFRSDILFLGLKEFR